MSPRKNITRMIMAALGGVTACCIVLSLSGCSGGADNNGAKTANAEDDASLVGAGSTFVYPLFSKMFDAYGQANNVKINYQSIGSGAGIQQITSKTVDFGGSDASLNETQTQTIGVPMLHVPMASVADVISHKAPAIRTPGPPAVTIGERILKSATMTENLSYPNIHQQTI